MFMPITMSDGNRSRRKKVNRSSGKREVTIILIGLLTGSKNDAVSAMNVQAKRKGRMGKRSRVTSVYTIGVRIKAVASLERNIEIRHPSRNVFRNRRCALLPARRAA